MIQINTDNIENRIVELYKTKHGLKNKEEAIRHMINFFKKDFKKEDLERDWRNDPATDKQKGFLKSLNISIKKGLTKLEADELIKENKDRLECEKER